MDYYLLKKFNTNQIRGTFCTFNLAPIVPTNSLKISLNLQMLMPIKLIKLL